ncbi:hypothetical protein CTAYLR_007723 [Chrysophaeum taylorii]|uniref:Kinesin-like protein n=1 Tax=Chrysophaeum taylorii TaxID=2483200 RepID=A0AAD7XPF1_9STRA|nr:hypothetical protein CTAYLR_007723 [Chrysophaeum taylorii]
MRGYHGAVVAYGQTATGKTHTMQGTPQEPGLIPLAVEECFEYIELEETECVYALRVSYLEVYNETVRDLLSDRTPRFVDDRIENVTEESVASIGDVYAVIVRGEQRRHVGSTDANARSSRSHAILRLSIESKASTTLTATLSFVDLAGSEKAGGSAARSREGKYINKSLHALALVVAKLADGHAHIPYRDSKLTRLLQPALGGNARVAVVCTVALAPEAAEETAATLMFASRAKKVVQTARKNSVVDAESQIASYRAQVDDLKGQLKAAREQPASLGADERAALAAALDQLERLILRSGRPVSPKRDERFFAVGRRRERSRTLPPVKDSSSGEEEIAVEQPLLRIKAAIERALGGSSSSSSSDTPLLADDTAFVLQQLDKVEAENRNLKTQVSHLTSLLHAREAELRKIKGGGDETF